MKCIGEGTCLCGVHIRVGYVEGHAVALHPLPLCETFIRIESPLDYVKYLNDQHTN